MSYGVPMVFLWFYMGLIATYMVGYGYKKAHNRPLNTHDAPVNGHNHLFSNSVLNRVYIQVDACQPMSNVNFQIYVFLVVMIFSHVVCRPTIL